MGSSSSITGAVKAIDAIEHHTNPRCVVNEFADYARSFGFSTVAVGQIKNPAFDDKASKIHLSTWPKDWADYWVKHQLVVSDPVAKMALLQNRPFRWSEAFERHGDYARSHGNMHKEFGLEDGFAIPVHTGDGPPGCVSLGCEKFELDPSQLASIEIAAVHCYVRLEKLFGLAQQGELADLTHRESEILHFVAAGKTNWEIGQILSISEYHVRDCLKSVFKKLNTVSRAHTVATALRLNLIFP